VSTQHLRTKSEYPQSFRRRPRKVLLQRGLGKHLASRPERIRLPLPLVTIVSEHRRGDRRLSGRLHRFFLARSKISRAASDFYGDSGLCTDNGGDVRVCPAGSLRIILSVEAAGSLAADYKT